LKQQQFRESEGRESAVKPRRGNYNVNYSANYSVNYNVNYIGNCSGNYTLLATNNLRLRFL